MMKKLKLAVFISGRGSNMRSIVQACAEVDFPAEVSVVVSNNPDAAGLDFAKENGLACVVVDHKSFHGKAAFENAIYDALQDYEIDLICLAGFMRILSADFIARWPENSIINIHPSLLPDYKGLDTHQRAIDDGRDQGGCSVHYVTPEVDGGAVILQRAVPILPDDDADSLAERVLPEEHIAYPEAIRLIAAS